MNISRKGDGASCKGRENGDASSESERPLKKARFAWQVKGKHHLKSDSTETEASTSNSSTPVAEPDPDNETDMETASSRKILDCIEKRDSNALHSVMSESKTLLKQVTQKDVIMYSINVPYNSSERSNNVQSQPMSAVVSPSFIEDLCIARWQSLQRTKAFVDNTINSVLESWMGTEGNNARNIALAALIDNLPVDNSIENEGILMAISAHGLQNSDSRSTMSDSLGDDTLPPRSSTPLFSEDELEYSTDQASTVPSDLSPNFGLSWSSTDEKNPLLPLSESSDETYQCYSEDQNIGIDYNENTDENYFDILNAGVVLAINEKGLTTFGTDYG